jgi:hypothetical protein
MLVTPTARGFRIVTQADHARLAADLLRLFRLPELVEHPRRELLLRAVAEHDNGWWEADAAPRLDAAGSAPLDFRAVSAELRQEIWQRGVERFAVDSPYVAALVAGHALRILRPDPLDAAWTAFRAGLEERRKELLEEAGETLTTAMRDDFWLELADDLALAAATGEATFVSLPGWRAVAVSSRTSAEVAGSGAAGAGAATSADEDSVELALAPFPFAGVTTFGLSCRILPPGRFASASGLGLALTGCTFRRLRVRLRALSGSSSGSSSSSSWVPEPA